VAPAGAGSSPRPSPARACRAPAHRSLPVTVYGWKVDFERISSIRASTVAGMPAPDAPAAKVSMDDLGEEPSVAPKAAWSLSSLLGLDKCCAPASVTVFAQQLEVTRHPRARLHWAVGAWLRARCR